MTRRHDDLYCSIVIARLGLGGGDDAVLRRERPDARRELPAVVAGLCGQQTPHVADPRTGAAADAQRRRFLGRDARRRRGHAIAAAFVRSHRLTLQNAA